MTLQHHHRSVRADRELWSLLTTYRWRAWNECVGHARQAGVASAPAGQIRVRIHSDQCANRPCLPDDTADNRVDGRALGLASPNSSSAAYERRQLVLLVLGDLSRLSSGEA